MFGSFSRLFVENQLIWQRAFDNSYTQRLFLPRCYFVLQNCTYANAILIFFSTFPFFVCFLVLITRNSLFVQNEGLYFRFNENSIRFALSF